MPFSLYVAAAIFGALFVGWGVISGADSGDTDVHVDHDAGAWALLSLRSAAFGALAFGAIGVLGHLGRWSSLLVALLATGIGAAVWIGVSLLFRHLRRSQSGELLSDTAWIGADAELVVPFDHAGLGRISLLLGGQVVEIAARRAPKFADVPSASFARCIVDQLDGDTAIVLPRERLVEG